MRKELEIPAGKILVKIDKETYKLVDANKDLPKTWEEYCSMCPIKDGEYYIDSVSNIRRLPCKSESISEHRISENRNLFILEEQAEAFLALIQLIRLRDYYNNSIAEDKNYWEQFSVVYNIYEKVDTIYNGNDLSRHMLSFKTYELAEIFRENFKELLQKAKELI